MKGGMVGWDRKPAAVGEDRRARSRMDGWRKDRSLLQHAHDQEKYNAPCCRSIQSFKAVCVCERTGELQSRKAAPADGRFICALLRHARVFLCSRAHSGVLYFSRVRLM